MNRFSVIIPAHDEAKVIERCLLALAPGPGDDIDIEIVVVANGCGDDTARRARAAAPEARVIELPEASKVAALNVGDRAATAFPRFYVDADVEVTAHALTEACAVLATAPCAAPRPHFALSDRSWPIRAFYRLWQQMPYLNDTMVGTGVYGLSEDGRSRFGDFPAVTADDQFVMQLFPPDERRTVTGVTFVVHPPRTLRGLVRMRTRAYRGNRELAAAAISATNPTGGAGAAIVRLARRPRNWPDIAVFTLVNLVAKVQMRRSTGIWERDDSARSAA